jgi:hypothetical protein
MNCESLGKPPLFPSQPAGREALKDLHSEGEDVCKHTPTRAGCVNVLSSQGMLSA